MSDSVYRYCGNTLDVAWDERLCIHIGECGQAEGHVFVDGRDPWCQPDLCANSSTLKEIVQRCPSGALYCLDHNNQLIEDPPVENTIMVSYSGPYFVRGRLSLDNTTDNMPGIQHRTALCRCGLSANKPFCDNSHIKSFTDSGAVGETGNTASITSGLLEISCLPDGPLWLSGKFCIIAGSGRRAWCGDEAALCRCGASNNKPFCDGSHRNINFRT